MGKINIIGGSPITARCEGYTHTIASRAARSPKFRVTAVSGKRVVIEFDDQPRPKKKTKKKKATKRRATKRKTSRRGR